MAFETIVGLQVRDREGYARYRAGMTPILRSHGGGFRYDFVVSETLESEAEHPINRVFAIHFPDRAAKERFFADPAYLKVRKEFFEPSVSARVTIAEYDRP